MQDINGIEDLRTEGPFEIYELNRLWIHGRVNEHGRLMISGIIKQEDIMENNPQGKSITVWGKDRERPLFSGVIKTFSLTEEGGVSQAAIECSSFTSLLDRVPRSRSFQNPTMRYRDLLETAGKRFEQKNRLLVTAGEAPKKIGAPVIQYQETDWEFLKRMAGRLHTFLIPEITYPMTQLSIGCIRGESYSLEEDKVEEYEEILDLDRFRSFGGSQSKAYYISYRIRISGNYELGDRIQWKGQEFRIMEKNLFLERGRIEGEYLLGFEQGFRLEEQCNQKIRGVSLFGCVIDRKEGMLKVHLDIDPDQASDQAYWYPYSPVTGSIMYSVPELGTQVLLNVKSDHEEEAVVSCCIRTNPTVPLLTEIKTMWTGGANYTAASEYMGFDCESAGSLAEAFVLDDEIGLTAYAKKGLWIQAKGAVTLESHGSISLEGVTETKLTHPKAKEEQAWIAMDCGRMRLGGSFIAHSGMAAGNDMGQSNETADCSASVMRESFSMIPMAAKPEILQGLGAEGRIYSTMAAVASFGTESETGTVTQLQESVDSTEEAEKKAYIYVGGGHLYEGEVRGGKTYITYNYNGFLRSFFDGVDDSEYSIEPTTNKTTGEYRAYKDELYNLSVEELAEKTGYSDVLSSWEYTDEYRYVVCNPVAKYGPYQLVRKGKEIKIKLYTRINAFKKEDSDDPEVKKVKPYENEKQGWFASKDEDYRNYTFYDFIMAGIQRWEGVYENHYEVVSEHWWIPYGRKIFYDYFGLDGAVELKIEVCTPTEQHPVGNRVYIFDNREEALAEMVYTEFDDEKFIITEERNWPSVIGKKTAFAWSILNIGTVLLFTRQLDVKKNHEYSYKSNQFLDMIAHEFGHVWGLHDAYKKSDSPGWTGAKKTEEVNKDNIMRSNKEVQSNDIEMILQAWKENEWQYYYDVDTHDKSKAIDYV